jgi:hypothetical protein
VPDDLLSDERGLYLLIKLREGADVIPLHGQAV